MNKLVASFAAALSLLGGNQALADCGGAALKEVMKAYADAQKLEKKGEQRAALGAYAAAQEHTCEANPVVADAITRAAALGRSLGDAARTKGQHELALTSYELGGHFAAADQALQAWIQAEPDSLTLYQRAYDHVATRSLEAFAANNAARLEVTGAYKLDPSLVDRVHAMPEQGIARAMQAETAAFNETFLAKHVAMINSRPADAADIAGLAQWQDSYVAFRQQFPREYLKDAQQALDLAKSWANTDRKNTDTAGRLQRVAQRADARLSTLTQKYPGAPDSLSGALGFLPLTAHDQQLSESRATRIRSQAESLGDAALAKSNFMLAIDYYRVANAGAKAQRASAAMEVHVQARMQNSLDAMRGDAETLAAQFSDPGKVEELKRSAQVAQRSMQESAAARKAPAAMREKDDLAKELGL